MYNLTATDDGSKLEAKLIWTSIVPSIRIISNGIDYRNQVFAQFTSGGIAVGSGKCARSVAATARVLAASKSMPVLIARTSMSSRTDRSWDGRQEFSDGFPEV